MEKELKRRINKMMNELQAMKELIDSDALQEKQKEQEQPMPDSTKLIELWHEDKEMLKEKDFRNDPWRLAYNAFLCGFGRGIAVNKPKQPEVDLEKEIDKVVADYSFTKTIDSGGFKTIVLDYEKIARHFFELGLKIQGKSH